MGIKSFVGYALVTLSMHSSLAMQCQFYGENMPRNMGPPPIFSDEVLSELQDYELSASYLGKKYIKKTPVNYQSIVFFENDVPFYIIKDRAEKSYQFWQKVDQKFIDYFANYRLDWVTYADLNIQAHQVWNQLLDCNKGNEHRLRKNYFTGTLCENKARAKVIEKSMIELSTNLYTFLTTSPFIFSQSQLSTYAHIGNYEFERVVIPRQHPLLYQMLLQNWALILNPATEPNREFGLPQFLEDVIFADQRSFSPESLSDREKFHFNIKEPSRQMHKANYSPDLIKWHQFKMQVATLLTGQDLDCEALGLWPAMNRALVSTDIYLRNSEYAGVLGKIFGTLSKQYEKSCGLKIEISKALPNTYNGMAISHIFESRRLFATYYPMVETKSFIESVRKDMKLTPFEKLICK